MDIDTTRFKSRCVKEAELQKTEATISFEAWMVGWVGLDGRLVGWVGGENPRVWWRKRRKHLVFLGGLNGEAKIEDGRPFF